MTEFTKRMEFDIDGQRVFVISSVPQVLVAAPSVCKVAIVSDTVGELRSIATFVDAAAMLLRSAACRGITPVELWAIGMVPVDDPLWADYLDPALAARIGAKIQEINGHVAVFALLDTAMLRR